MTVDEIHKPPRPGGNSSIIELNFNYSLGRSSLTSHLLTLSLMPFQSTDDHACDALSWDPCGNGDEIELLVLQPRIIKSKLSLRCDQVPDIFFSLARLSVISCGRGSSLARDSHFVLV